MMEGEKEEKEGKKNNTVETSCIARFKLYIHVISYGNSENGKGHQEWSKKLLRWKVSFMLTVRYHLQRWRETTLLRKLLVIVPGWKKKKKIMGTLFLGYGENRNKFEQTDLRQKRRWDGKRWRIFFFYLSVFMSQVKQASIEEIDFRWKLFIHRNIYFSSSNEIDSVTIILKRKTIRIDRICNK